jgi:hypothetical protein
MRKLALTFLLIVTLLCGDLLARAVMDPRGFPSPHDERIAFLERIPGDHQRRGCIA